MLSIWWSARRAPRVPELASESSRERRARTSANSAPTKKPLTATSAATAAKRSAVTCSVSARACASVHLHVGHTVAPRASRGLVLHGESVEKGEDHHRRPELDRAGRLGSKDELGAYAVLPDERHHAPGGEDGEQVERDRLERQQERAEGTREQDEGDERDQAKHERENAVDVVDEVLDLGRGAADGSRLERGCALANGGHDLAALARVGVDGRVDVDDRSALALPAGAGGGDRGADAVDGGERPRRLLARGSR